MEASLYFIHVSVFVSISEKPVYRVKFTLQMTMAWMADKLTLLYPQSTKVSRLSLLPFH